MRLVIWAALIGLGIYLGITYQDPIMDALNMRDMESTQDKMEDLSDQMKDSGESMKSKMEDLSEQASDKIDELSE